MIAELALPSLCLVTDRNRCDGRALVDVVDRAVVGGANMVQLREKDLPARDLHSLALRIRDVTVGRALLFVNDRLDVALACGADGVQLGEDALPVDAAREVAAGRLLLGRSVHSVGGALEAQSKGADLLVLGTVFPTTSHPGVAAGGLGLVREVAGSVSIPIIAIGGIVADNAASVMEAGASGAAVITAITRSQDPRRAAAGLKSSLDGAWAARAAGRTVAGL